MRVGRLETTRNRRKQETVRVEENREETTQRKRRKEEKRAEMRAVGTDDNR